MTAVLAVDVGGTSVKGAVVDADGRLLHLETLPTGSGEAAVRAVQEVVVRLGRAAAERGILVRGVGVVTPGIIDPDAGVVRYASNLDWRDLPLRDRVAVVTDLPVTLGHDVRAAGAAEGVFGQGQGSVDFLHVSIGTGIAAALFAGGRPVLGSDGGAGELGHVPVVDDGEQCPCGQRGCLEVYASGGGMARRYERLAGRAASAPEIVARLDSDAVAAQVWSDGVRALVRGLAICALLLEPERVVLGGGLAHAGEVLLSPVMKGLEDALVWRRPPEVRLSHLAQDGAVIGAALLALR